jgi:hypothetical protein
MAAADTFIGIIVVLGFLGLIAMKMYSGEVKVLIDRFVEWLKNKRPPGGDSGNFTGEYVYVPKQRDFQQ